MEEVDEDVDGAYAAEAEIPTEDDPMESLLAEGDDDAVFISDLRMPHPKSSRPMKSSQLHSIATAMPEKVE